MIAEACRLVLGAAAQRAIADRSSHASRLPVVPPRPRHPNLLLVLTGPSPDRPGDVEQRRHAATCEATEDPADWAHGVFAGGGSVGLLLPAASLPRGRSGRPVQGQARRYHPSQLVGRPIAEGGPGRVSLDSAADGWYLAAARLGREGVQLGQWEHRVARDELHQALGDLPGPNAVRAVLREPHGRAAGEASDDHEHEAAVRAFLASVGAA